MILAATLTYLVGFPAAVLLATFVAALRRDVLRNRRALEEAEVRESLRPYGHVERPPYGRGVRLP